MPLRAGTRSFACPKDLDQKGTSMLLDCFLARKHGTDLPAKSRHRSPTTRYRKLLIKKLENIFLDWQLLADQRRIYSWKGIHPAKLAKTGAFLSPVRPAWPSQLLAESAGTSLASVSRDTGESLNKILRLQPRKRPPVLQPGALYI